MPRYLNLIIDLEDVLVMEFTSKNELIIVLLPVIVGALITIIPNLVSKYIEAKSKIDETNRNLKINTYTQLITVIAYFLKNQSDEMLNLELVNIINTVNLIGSSEVVIALQKYMKTWGKENNQFDQNKNYDVLLKALRKDLKIKGWNISSNEPIGLIDVVIIDKGQ